MVRFFHAVTLFVRGRLPGRFALVGGWLVLVLKRLPVTVSGFLLFLYVYGPAYQRYRGTFVAVRAWYRALARPGPAIPPPRRRRRPGWVAPTAPNGVVVRVRPGGPWRFTPAEVERELYDADRYTLDSAFPAATDEPFQELAHEHFDDQQDFDTFQDDEPHDETDHLWGTREVPWQGEEFTRFERDRFRRLARRETLVRAEYYLLDEPADSFAPGRTVGGLSRLVSPGDGPAAEDQEEPEFLLTTWRGALSDWYHHRVQPARLSQFPPVWGTFSYLLYEHRLLWRPDPTGRPVGWYRGAAGLVPWLHRTRRRRWGRTRWHIQRYYKGRRQPIRTRRWETRRRRRRVRHSAWWADRRWRRPNWRPDDTAVNVFAGPLVRWGLTRAAARLAARAQRFARAGILWVRRRRPPGRSAGRTPRAEKQFRPGEADGGGFARATAAVGRGRPRRAAWHAPRYHPVYDRHRRTAPGGLPPTGAALVWGAWLAGAAALAGWTFGEGYLSYFSPVGEDPQDLLDLQGLMTDPNWRSDFFRRVAPGVPNAAEVTRMGDPRGPTSVNRPGFLQDINPAWRLNPGLDMPLFSEHYNRAYRSIFHADVDWVYGLNEKMMLYNRRIGRDRNYLVFLWHAGWRQPSWAHLEEDIGDWWVHHPDFRLIPGKLEPHTKFRFIDREYHRFAQLGPLINDLVNEGEVTDGIDEVVYRWFHIYRAQTLRHLLALPDWVSPRDDPARPFQRDYLRYWGVLSRVAGWPSSTHLDMWPLSATFGFLDVVDWFDRGTLYHSERHELTSLPTRWETHLNAALVRGWDRPAEYFYDEVGFPRGRLWAWFDRNVTWAIPPVSAGVALLVRSWLYLAGPVWWFTYRTGYLAGVSAGVATHPVTRRPGRSVRAVRGVVRVVPRLRGRLVGRGPRAVRPHPGWSREAYWAGVHRGRYAGVPRLNRPVTFGVIPRVTSPFRALARPVGPPRRPVPGAGLLYGVTRAGASRVAIAGAAPTGRAWLAPRPGGWLVRPVARTASPVRQTFDERPRLFRRRGARPGRRRRRVDPGGTTRHHRRRRPRTLPNGVAARIDPVRPVRADPVRWAYRGNSLGATLQHGWHHRRYRNAVGAFRPGPVAVPVGREILTWAGRDLAGAVYPGGEGPPLRGSSHLDAGYDASLAEDFENDDYIAPANNHHDDVEEFDEPTTAMEEYEGMVYLSTGEDALVGVVLPAVPADHLVRRRLRSYERFGSLPTEAYRAAAPADYFDGDVAATGWSPAAGDHPVWREALLGWYFIPRWGRRLGRATTPPSAGGVGWDDLWDEVALTGWMVHDLEIIPGEYHLDDTETVEFGAPPGEGYRLTAVAARWAGRYRPATVAAGLEPAWAVPAGWNLRRYLAGEDLGDPGEDDPEGYFLECLSRRYLDSFEPWVFMVELENVYDRDHEDIYEGAPFEEEHQEVPRTRPVDYPGWLLAAAVAGAVVPPDGATPEAAFVRHRPGRATLRRYYRVWRRARASQLRRGDRPDLPGLSWAAAAADAVDFQRGHLEDWPPPGEPAPAEVDALAPPELSSLEWDEEDGEEVIRLWALTEVYWGDLPSGSAYIH